MSKKSKKELTKDTEGQKSVSVYDFLYCDGERINLFLSQFNNMGQLTEIAHSERSKESTRSFNISIGAKAFGTGGNAGLSLGPKATGEQERVEKFSPQWINVLRFLDFLSEVGIIKKDLENASIGEIILTNGFIEIIDLGLVKELYKIPSIKSQIIEGVKEETEGNISRQQRRRKERKKKKSEEEEIIELLGALPHTIQARMEGSDKVWATLKTDGLIVSTVDILLNHSVKVEGRWWLLGILDARPDSDVEPLENQIRDQLSETDPLEFLQASVVFYRTIAPFIRTILGRPMDAYGVTPLLIFREIGGEK